MHAKHKPFPFGVRCLLTKGLVDEPQLRKALDGLFDGSEVIKDVANPV